MAGIKKDVLLLELRELISRTDDLKEKIDRSAFLSWKSEVEVLLAHIYPEQSSRIRKFSQIKFFPVKLLYNDEDLRSSFKHGLEEAETLLTEYSKEIGQSGRKVTISYVNLTEQGFSDFIGRYWMQCSLIAVGFFIFVLYLVPAMIE